MTPSSEKHLRNNINNHRPVDFTNENIPLLLHKADASSRIYHESSSHLQQPQQQPQHAFVDVLVDGDGSECVNSNSNGFKNGMMIRTTTTNSTRAALVSSFRRGLSDFIVQHTGSIGWLGSISITVNSLTGPAMLNLPATFQRSGLFPTLATLLFVCLLSSRCSLHMANTISKVPGNEHFQRHIEYSEAFRRFWGDRWFTFTQFAFFGCVTCLNISSIVDTARVMDTFLGHWVQGGSAALQISFGDNNNNNNTQLWTVEMVRWTYSNCHPNSLLYGKCEPFLHRQDGVLLTLGYLITTMALLPLALMDLKENALWQIIGFAVLLATSLQFAVAFCLSPLFDFKHLPLWGETWGSLFGVVLFNFCLVIAIPAWLYEKEPHVPVPAVIHSSYAFSLFLYVVLGVLGACSLPLVSEDMLESMMSGAMGTSMQLGASVFALAIVGLGVPLFSVLTRLNLTGSGTCSDRVGNLLAVYLPFGISWMLYHRVTQLLSWGGILFTSAVAFLLPLCLAWHSVQVCDTPGSINMKDESWWDCFFDKKTMATSATTKVATAEATSMMATISALSRRQESRAVAVLLALAVLSVLVAIGGLIASQS